MSQPTITQKLLQAYEEYAMVDHVYWSYDILHDTDFIARIRKELDEDNWSEEKLWKPEEAKEFLAKYHLYQKKGLIGQSRKVLGEKLKTLEEEYWKLFQERNKLIADIFENAGACKEAGIKFVQEVRDGQTDNRLLEKLSTSPYTGFAYTRMKMKVTDKILNMWGTGHGGAIATLIDSAAGAAAFTLVDFERQLVVTTDLNISYLRPANKDKHVCADAKVIFPDKESFSYTGGHWSEAIQSFMNTKDRKIVIVEVVAACSGDIIARAKVTFMALPPKG